MKALDLFCCDGGATRGLQMAGFHVTGIDIKPRPRYCGDAFIQADALHPPVDLRRFDFIHASPPCQAFTALRFMPTAREHPNLIPQTREMLIASGVPYCIENVEGAPLGDSGYLIMLCGTMFGLQTADGRAELRRHRLFETSFSIPLRPQCQHGFSAPISLGVHGEGARNVTEDRRMGPSRRKAITVTGSTAQTNTVTNRVRQTFTVQHAREAMGIDWMGMSGLSQAIPPAYSQFIGEQAIAAIRRTRSAA